MHSSTRGQQIASGHQQHQQQQLLFFRSQPTASKPGRGLQRPASVSQLPSCCFAQAAAAARQCYQQQLITQTAPRQQQQQQQQQNHCHPQQLPHQRRRAPVKAAAAAAAVAQQPGFTIHGPQSPQWQHQQQCRMHVRASAAAAAADGFDGSSSSEVPHHSHPPSSKVIPPRIEAAADQETYSLRDTQILVETAMLSAVSGLAFLLSTLLKLDNSLGYFLPLPITIAACRSGVAAGWHTMMATAFLLLVLLGPLRAITYVLMHGILAASLGSMWVWKWPWAISIPAGAVLRMSGQLGYLVLSSVTMNENLFQVMLANVHNLLDQLSAAVGSYGSPSTLAIVSMIFALLLVNGICYVFLIHVVYHVILGSMGFKLGALPGFVRKYLYAGVPQQQQQQQQKQ